MAADKGAVLFIQFAKAPRVGAVKTRMQPALTAIESCDLHRQLMQWTTRQLCQAGLAPVELWTDDKLDQPLLQQCLDLGVVSVRRQQGADLGARMFHALSDGLERYHKVVLVGSDCPGIDTPYLASALEALEQQSIVLGPATDGGYVLIGARQIDSAVFEGVVWGGAEVYAATVARLQHLALSWSGLKPLADIDRPEDLPIWEALREAQLRQVPPSPGSPA